MKCEYCRVRGGQHNQACPKLTGKLELFKKGQQDGLKRRPSTHEDPTYSLGWIDGDCWADERENREPDPRFD